MNQSVDAKFPDLALEDQNGKELKLSEITEGKFPLIVVFYRGYW